MFLVELRVGLMLVVPQLIQRPLLLSLDLVDSTILLIPSPRCESGDLAPVHVDAEEGAADLALALGWVEPNFDRGSAGYRWFVVF